MEAVGQNDCGIYGEDTVTDEEGKFRLRGLLVRPGPCFARGCFHTVFRGVLWCPQDCWEWTGLGGGEGGEVQEPSASFYLADTLGWRLVASPQSI